MDADSEDVVIENSPLYVYLKESGYSDFECSTKTTPSLDSVEIKDVGGWNQLYSLFRRLFSALKTSWKRCCNAVFAVFLQDFQTLGCSTRKEIISFISNAKLLIEDDRKFLTSFSSEFIENYECCALSSFEKWKYDVLTIGSPYILAGSVALFSWYVSSNSPFIRKSSVWNILDKLLLALVIAIIVGHSTRNFIYYSYKKNIKISLQKLKELIEISISIGSLAKKCITFIQESEIVARGFTLASLNVPVQRLELSSVMSTARQCPELRESIFHWTRNMYYRYRHATLEIYKIIPLQPTLDVLSHYLASIKLKEFGPILELSINSESEKQQLKEASDQFSLSSLKSVFQLMEVQQSEFFRLFTMGFIPNALVEMKQDPISALWIFSELIPYIEQLIEANQKIHSLLIATYDYYRSLEVSHLLTEGNNLSYVTQKSPHASVSLALHSLNLHLRAALKRVQNAELQLEESITSSCDNSLMNLHTDIELTTCLNEVRAELEASKECLNETEQELNSLANKDVSEEIPEQTTSERHIPEQFDPPVISLLDEPIIQDQVFEAFTDNIEMETSIAYSASFDTQEKLKEQKEASAHLLKELRSVLVSKALEHKLREEKALSMRKTTLETSPNKQDPSPTVEDEKQKEEGSPMQEEMSSDDSPQDNLTDKSIETLRESDEIERWELLSDKEIEPTSNDNETHLYRSSENTESIALDSENNITDISPNANVHCLLDGVSFALGSSIAALAAERCKSRGMQIETFAAEGEECFGDDDDSS